MFWQEALIKDRMIYKILGEWDTISKDKDKYKDRYNSNNNYRESKWKF